MEGRASHEGCPSIIRKSLDEKQLCFLAFNLLLISGQTHSEKPIAKKFSEPADKKDWASFWERPILLIFVALFGKRPFTDKLHMDIKIIHIHIFYKMNQFRYRLF